MKSINSIMLELDTRKLFSYSYIMKYKAFIKSDKWKSKREVVLIKKWNDNIIFF